MSRTLTDGLKGDIGRSDDRSWAEEEYDDGRKNETSVVGTRQGVSPEAPGDDRVGQESYCGFGEESGHGSYLPRGDHSSEGCLGSDLDVLELGSGSGAQISGDGMETVID